VVSQIDSRLPLPENGVMRNFVDGVNQSLVYYTALKKAGIPVEMHLYAQGGHAFGLRRTKLPVTKWPQLVETWLRTIGMISE
jgi:acetyl esterase/lipase